MLSSRWRARKPGGIIQSMSKGQRISGANALSLSPAAGETDVPAQAARQRRWILPPSVFCSIQSSVGWVMPTHTGQGHLLYWVHPLKYLSHQETPSHTHPEIKFNQKSGQSVQWGHLALICFSLIHTHRFSWSVLMCFSWWRTTLQNCSQSKKF